MRIETYALQIADNAGNWNTPEDHIGYGFESSTRSAANRILSGWHPSERPCNVDGLPVRVIGIVIL